MAVMLKSLATVILSTAIVLTWLNWVVGVFFILLVFILGSVVFHLSLIRSIVHQKFRELASAGVSASAMQRQRRTIRRQMIRAMA